MKKNTPQSFEATASYYATAFGHNKHYIGTSRGIKRFLGIAVFTVNFHEPEIFPNRSVSVSAVSTAGT